MLNGFIVSRVLSAGFQVASPACGKSIKKVRISKLQLKILSLAENDKENKIVSNLKTKFTRMRTHRVQAVCVQLYAGASFCQKKNTQTSRNLYPFFLGRIETSFRKGATIDQKCGT